MGSAGGCGSGGSPLRSSGATPKDAQHEDGTAWVWDFEVTPLEPPFHHASSCTLATRSASFHMMGTGRRFLSGLNRITCHNGCDWSFPKREQTRSGAFAGRRPLVQKLLLNSPGRTRTCNLAVNSRLAQPRAQLSLLPLEPQTLRIQPASHYVEQSIM